MNSVLREEIIYIKSQPIYIIAFSVLFWFSVSSLDFTTREYFYFANHLTVFVLTLLFTLYIIQVIIAWLFEDRNFYQRSLIYSFVLTSLLMFAMYLNNADNSFFIIVIIGFIYFVIIEVPRLAIIFALDADKLDLKFLRIVAKHLNKVITLYLILIVLIIVQYFNDANSNMYILLVSSSLIVISIMSFYAWRLNSDKTLNTLKKIALIIGGILFNVVLLKYSVSII
jgi:hypothetical protein